jgi:hypothetical protein
MLSLLQERTCSSSTLAARGKASEARTIMVERTINAELEQTGVNWGEITILHVYHRGHVLNKSLNYVRFPRLSGWATFQWFLTSHIQLASVVAPRPRQHIDTYWRG